MRIGLPSQVHGGCLCRARTGSCAGPCWTQITLGSAGTPKIEKVIEVATYEYKSEDGEVVEREFRVIDAKPATVTENGKTYKRVFGLAGIKIR